MSGINSLIFSTVRYLFKKENAFSFFAHTPIFAQPPLSPDLAPKSSPRGLLRVSPDGGGGISIGCF